MKALLLTVLIILVILVILIYYLNQYTVKKPVIKEQFYGDAGDVYSLQSGTSEFETVTKLESDVNNIIVKQEQNTSDLSAFKTDTTNQLSTLNTGFGQFKTDASNKLTVLQENSVNQRTILDVYGNNINDLTSRFKGANDKIAVVDGKLVSITTDQQKQLDSLTSNYKTLNDTQNAFYGVIDNKKQEALKYTDDSISKLSTSLNKSIADESRLINNTNTQFSSLQNDYTKFKADTSKIDGDQQSAINSVLTKASTLNDAINAAQNRINDVAATFKNYISRDQLGNFVLKAELQPYATQNQLQNYSLKTDSANFITLNELNQYVKKTDNKPTIDSLTTANNSITNLNSQVKNIQSDYVQKATLGSYVKTDDLKPINDSLSGANSAIGSLNSQLNNIKGDYVPKATLGSYVTTANLKPTIDSLNAANAALQNLSTTVSTVLNNYVTKADLPKLAMDATGITVLSQALDGMKNAVASLSNTIADVKSSLSNYVLKSDWQAANANFALKTDLSGYVPTSQMTNYYSKKDVDTATNNIGSQINAINTNISQNVAMKNDLAGYVPNSQLTNFYSKKDIDASNGNINSQINAINTNISQNVALKNDLKGYVQLSQLPQWPNKADIDALTANFNSQISTIKAGTSQILDIMQINTTLKTDQLIATKGLWNTSMPKGLTGVHTTDLYGEGTVATGTGGNINAYMNSAGNAKIGAKLGVGIDPSAMGGQTFRVETPTSDWQAYFHNPNGDRNAYINHGDGYGMYINTNDQRADHYAMQLHNGKQELMTVMNDGQVRVTNNIRTGGEIRSDAIVKGGDGSYIHANGTVYGKDLMRSDTGFYVQNDAAYMRNNGLIKAGESYLAHPNGHSYIRPQKDGGNIYVGDIWANEVNLGKNSSTINVPGQLCVGNKCVNQSSFISKEDVDTLTNTFNTKINNVTAAPNNSAITNATNVANAANAAAANATNVANSANATANAAAAAAANATTIANSTKAAGSQNVNNVNGKLTVTGGGIYTNDWFRALGNNGIYFEDHGGGWNMTDNTWIRSYGGKSVATDADIYIGRNSQINGSQAITGNLNVNGQLCVGNKCVNQSSFISKADVDNATNVANSANATANAAAAAAANATTIANSAKSAGSQNVNNVNGNLTATGSINANGGIYAYDWFRARGNNGFYFEDRGGGWNMTDTAWIRSYGGKSVYSDQEIRANRMTTEADMNIGGSLNIANKWRLGNTGDAWLRLNAVGRSDANPSAFSTEGFAAGKFWTITGQYLQGSDRRIKNNIENINNSQVNDLLKLNPKTYSYKDDVDNTKRFGFIAQDVEQIYPEMVTIGPNGMKSMNYTDIIPLTVANIKDLKQSLPDKETLCLGDVCINKDQLRKLKNAIGY